VTTGETAAAGAETPGARALRVATIALLVVAAGLLAFWLWTRYCRFPVLAWNDMRLAPTIALAQGWPVYPTANAGTINTWMYGPLPVFVMWPASWAESAIAALLVAAVINLALTLVPLALVCAAWPGARSEGSARIGRAAAFLLCLAAWPELHYSVLFSDNLAVACGLVSNLVLVRARGAAGYWIAATLAAAAVGCKQIAVGIPLAQVAWLGLTHGIGAALRHAVRCALVGAVLLTGAILLLGGEGMWFTLVKVPGGLTWVSDLGARLGAVAPALTVLVGLPLVVMVIFRRTFAEARWRLPALAWLCTLPLGLAGMLKVGGWTNSIHSFVLWLPPVVAGLVTFWPRGARRYWQVSFALAALAVGGVLARLILEPVLHVVPQTGAYHEAARLTAQYPRALWFPVHPLITLYSDRRYYHDEDGIYARLRSNHPVSAEHLASQLPPEMRAMAFRNNWNYWNIAQGMLPPKSHDVATEYWIVRSGATEGSR
jgi:hypothetical protein